MNITFLIGNGFDLNIGLRTLYSDFAQKYTDEKSEGGSVAELKESIQQHYAGDVADINWSDMELGFGEFTGKFCDHQDGDASLEECHQHLCDSLAGYLEMEEKRFIDKQIENDKKILEKLGKAFVNYTKGIRPVDVTAINNFAATQDGAYHINLLAFNYTQVLDVIQRELTKDNRIGTRRYRNSDYPNVIHDVLHVHGTTKHGMVFGVNDESQLHAEVFKAEEPERKALLIKADSNKIMGENIENRATDIINSSQILYIYGMSLGETDRRWWERILKHMKRTNQVVLIVQCYDAPSIGRTAVPFERYQRKTRERFLSFLPDLSKDEKEGLANRIYVTGENIFACLHDYTNAVYMPSPKKQA